MCSCVSLFSERGQGLWRGGGVVEGWNMTLLWHNLMQCIHNDVARDEVVYNSLIRTMELNCY